MTKNILFVCLGNICRSPTAEAVMTHLVKKNGLEKKISCDSAGTIGYHQGHKADSRMMRHAKKRGYSITSRSRQINPAIDFEKFDLILTMDNANFEDVRSLDWEKKYTHKIHKITDFCQIMDVSQVPDPYYGGAQGFEIVLDILEDACSGLLDTLNKE